MTTSSSQPKYVPPGTGSLYQVVTDRVHFKVLASDNQGAYSLFETQTQAHGGIPPHIQHQEDEVFYVLEGTYSFLLGDQQVEGRVGSLLFIPRGTPHGYTNNGETPARMLILVSPGGNHERFFMELGVPVADPTAPPSATNLPDVETIIRVSRKYGIELAPPPSAEQV